MEPSQMWKVLSHEAVTVGRLPTEEDESWATAAWTGLENGELAVVSPADKSLVRLDAMGRESVLIEHPPWQYDKFKGYVFMPRIRAQSGKIIYETISRIGWASIDGGEERIIEELDEGEEGTYVENFDTADEGVAYLRCRRGTKPVSCDLVVVDWDGEEVWNETLSIENPTQLACDLERRFCFVLGRSSGLCLVDLEEKAGKAETCPGVPWPAGFSIKGLLPESGILVLGRSPRIAPGAKREEGRLGFWRWKSGGDASYVTGEAPIDEIRVSGSFVYFLEYQESTMPSRILRIEAELVQQCLSRGDP